MVSATEQLIAILDRLRRLVSDATSQDQYIANRWAMVRQGCVYYKTDGDKERAEPLAKLVAAQVREEGARLCAQEQREARIKTAAELEAIRAALPDIAARAAVEIGVIARGLRGLP